MKFLNKAGLIIETNDAEKISIYKAKGLIEFIVEPKPKQTDIEPVDEFIVRKAPVKKKTVAKKRK